MTDQQRPAWAVRLQAEREARGWGPFEAARRLREAININEHPGDKVKSLAAQITRHEKGHTFPVAWARAYAIVYGIPREELFGTENASVIPGASVDIQAPPLLWEDNMERRVLLQLAALGISANAFGVTGEPVRQLLALAFNTEPRDLDGWHLTLSDHQHALLTRPPAQVRDGLMVDLVAVQRQLQNAVPGEGTELNRIAAALSMLFAAALSRLGDHWAIHWWRTAKTVADATGDLDLRLMIRCDEAQFGLYGQRDPATVIHLTDAAERLPGMTPAYWKANLAGTRATALTLQGRHNEAEEALHVLTDFPGGRTEPGLLPTLWSARRVHFSASWVHAGAGREEKADEEREWMLANAGGGYQYPVNVRLHEALCTVVNGGIDRGAQQATEILAALPSAQKSHMITETAKHVLGAVPVEQRDRPAVRELHALTAGV
ncbi:hypothetical protein [Actinomadura macra]|uniref:hypothetical protein n=1 Tax=Actinomadura macra TaxID=46164 RepID=UPI00083144C9|nr:hypothetical protein [Actinomadura macra]